MTQRFDEGAGFSEALDNLHEQASSEVGLDDFGETDYLEGLRILLDAYDNEAKFSPTGRQAAYATLVETLKRRLKSERLLRQHPSARDVRIVRPIIVLGLVRTGSTALHALLGQDPDIHVLEYWLACQPQPRPPRVEWTNHPDYQSSAAEIDAIYAGDPSLKAIHFMAPDLPEECRHFLAQSFTDDSFEVNATVPSYTAWYEKKHLKDTYRRHRDLVGLVASGSPSGRLILKYPVHMKNLAALLEVYPDACVVQTHRDPAGVMSSYVSLIAGFRAIYERDIDRGAIAREQLEVWASGAEHAIAVRRDRDPSQFFDLHYQEYISDPIASVRQIYERFGQELSAEGERRLQDWQDQNPPGKHGEHRHLAEALPITRGEIL